MKVGDLVKNRHGNTGIITKKYGRKTWWVYWDTNESCTIHERFVVVK